MFCNFGCFLAAIAKEFLEPFPPCIMQQHLPQIKSKPRNSFKSKVRRVQPAGLWAGSVSITTPGRAQARQILLPLLTEGLGKHRARHGRQLPAPPGQKHLEMSKVSKSGQAACMRSPQNQANSGRRTCLLEMVISNSRKLHPRQQPTCTAISYNHHHCLG